MKNKNAGLRQIGAGIDPADFIRARMSLRPVPSVAEISLYTAHPGSGLWRLAGKRGEGPPPYWAYVWAGGAALARHFLDHPEGVRARSVLDLGAGGGIVGIAAAKAGAVSVTAAENDRNGVTAIGLNARANGVDVAIVEDDMVGGDVPRGIGLIAVGDLFYAPGLARRVTIFLDRCVEAGVVVLVGDPGRAFLPRSRLEPIAEYAVPDFGDGGGALKAATVFSFH